MAYFELQPKAIDLILGQALGEQRDLAIRTLAEVYQAYNLEMPVIPEVPSQRFPIITFIGPPGSGKTEATRLLANEFDIEYIPERPGDNPELVNSYSKPDAETCFRSQVIMALLKFQNHMQARTLASQRPVIVEPSLATDLAYARTFAETGKMTTGQLDRYLAVYDLLQSLLSPAEADIAISVIPSIDKLKARISRRGRDYEANFTIPFLEGMIRLCNEEEKILGERCLKVGGMDYVSDTPRRLFRDFGLFARKLLVRENVRGFDGAQLLPVDLKRWGVIHRHSDVYPYKRDLI